MKSFLIVACASSLVLHGLRAVPVADSCFACCRKQRHCGDPPDQHFTPEQQKWLDARQELTATVVHNAGIYNGIMAGGLFWAAYVGTAGTELALVMMIGAVLAGVFGAATLKSPVPAVQSGCGNYRRDSCFEGQTPKLPFRSLTLHDSAAFPVQTAKEHVTRGLQEEFLTVMHIQC